MTERALPAHPSRRRAGTGFVRRLRLAGAAVADAYEGWLQRQALADLDPRLLDDIGISPAERERECAKIFRSSRR